MLPHIRHSDDCRCWLTLRASVGATILKMWIYTTIPNGHVKRHTKVHNEVKSIWKCAVWLLTEYVIYKLCNTESGPMRKKLTDSNFYYNFSSLEFLLPGTRMRLHCTMYLYILLNVRWEMENFAMGLFVNRRGARCSAMYKCITCFM